MSRSIVSVLFVATCAIGARVNLVTEDLEKDITLNEDIAEKKETQEVQANYKCGALMQTTEAYYPKKVNWVVKKWKACTEKCYGGKCPVKGESCSSVLSENPGIETAFLPGMISWTGPVRVNTDT